MKDQGKDKEDPSGRGYGDLDNSRRRKGNSVVYGLDYCSSSGEFGYGGPELGYGYGAWGMTAPPYVIPRIWPRSTSARSMMIPPPALGVQDGGVSKRNSHGHFRGRGRGHGRGRGRGSGSGNGLFSTGNRTKKHVTKEALDADLDEWRLKDKRYMGQSLDAELDDYWRKRTTSEDSKEGLNEGNDSPKLSEKDIDDGT